VPCRLPEGPVHESRQRGGAPAGVPILGQRCCCRALERVAFDTFSQKTQVTEVTVELLVCDCNNMPRHVGALDNAFVGICACSMCCRQPAVLLTVALLLCRARLFFGSCAARAPQLTACNFSQQLYSFDRGTGKRHRTAVDVLRLVVLALLCALRRQHHAVPVHRVRPKLARRSVRQAHAAPQECAAIDCNGGGGAEGHFRTSTTVAVRRSMLPALRLLTPTLLLSVIDNSPHCAFAVHALEVAVLESRHIVGALPSPNSCVPGPPAPASEGSGPVPGRAACCPVCHAAAAVPAEWFECPSF
jgi:fumarate reductase subunit D